MRWLYVSDTRFPLERANGIQTFETCHALAARGHEITLLVRDDTHQPPRDPFAFYGAEPLDTLRVVPLALRAGSAARRAAFLAVALEFASRRDADVLYTRDLGVAALALRLPPVLRPPVVYESHGLSATVGAELGAMLSNARGASAAKQRRLAARDRHVWRHADAYVTITSSLAGELAVAFGPRGALAVVPDGARPRSATPPPRADRIVVAYAGHLYPWKGVDTLVRALAQVNDIDGLIVGGHPAEPDLGRVRDLVTTLGLQDRVRLAGLVPPGDVAALLATANVLTLPNSALAISARYTSPLKLFEYLWAGRPIVASDLPSFREVLQDGVHALLVPPDDPGGLAAGLCRLRDDPGLRDRLAAASAGLAPEFSWDARARRLEAVVQGLLTKQDRRS